MMFGFVAPTPYASFEFEHCAPQEWSHHTKRPCVIAVAPVSWAAVPAPIYALVRPF